MPKSSIEQIKQFRHILKSCSFDSIIFLDLDNTVMKSSQELASDQWYYEFLKYACKENLEGENTAEKIEDLLLIIYHALQHIINIITVETNTIRIIKRLQDIGFPVYALTARGDAIVERTKVQLQTLGVDFDPKKLMPKSIIPLEGSQHPVIFDSGIIFCGKQDKGKCLTAFFSAFKIYDKKYHVVFADDKEINVLAVQKAISKLDGRFSGFRYGYLDEEITKLNMNIANKQLLEVLHLLPSDARLALTRFNIPGIEKSLLTNSLFAKKEFIPIVAETRADHSLTI